MNKHVYDLFKNSIVNAVLCMYHGDNSAANYWLKQLPDEVAQKVLSDVESKHAELLSKI